MIVRQRRVKTEAWQYNGLVDRAPRWVRASVRYINNNLILERRSGRQRIDLHDWLVRDLDSVDPLWLTDADFQKEYEMEPVT